MEIEPCELSAKFVFAVPVSSTVGFLSLLLCWVFFTFSFHCRSFLAKLGFCCAWPPLYWQQAKVVSARLNPSHGTRDVGGVCNFLSSVSPQQRFEIVDQCYSLITAQFYLASKE